MYGKLISIIIALFIGVSCSSLQGTSPVQTQQYADCTKCVSEEDYNTCVDQNEMLRKYLTECIKFSKKSVQAIEQCQDESRHKAWRWFGWGTGLGGGVMGILILVLWLAI